MRLAGHKIRAESNWAFGNGAQAIQGTLVQEHLTPPSRICSSPEFPYSQIQRGSSRHLVKGAGTLRIPGSSSSGELSPEVLTVCTDVSLSPDHRFVAAPHTTRPVVPRIQQTLGRRSQSRPKPA